MRDSTEEILDGSEVSQTLKESVEGEGDHRLFTVLDVQDEVEEPERFLAGFELWDPQHVEMMEKEVEQFGTHKRVPVDRLVAVEAFQDTDKILQFAREEKYNDNPISVVEKDERFYIVDGHHRAIAASFKKEDEIPALVLEED